eukprot:gene2420-2455_t
MSLTSAIAQKLIADTLKFCREKNFNPMAVAVFDARGAMMALVTEDGCPLLRWKIATGKAYGAVALGIGTRRQHAMAIERPHFMGAAMELAENGMVPVPGGVLIRDANKQVIGAIGVSGDTSDNDEAAASAAIVAAGFMADGG